MIRPTSLSLAGLRACSLMQPFADLVVDGSKLVETRGRDIGCRPEELLAIHASLSTFARWDAPEAWKVWERGTARCLTGGIVGVARVASVFRVKRNEPGDHTTSLETICVRGRIMGLREATEDRLDEEMALGDWRAGRFLTVFSEVVRLPKFVPCAGMPGLWAVTEPVIDAIATQFEARG